MLHNDHLVLDRHIMETIGQVHPDFWKPENIFCLIAKLPPESVRTFIDYYRGTKEFGIINERFKELTWSTSSANYSLGRPSLENARQFHPEFPLEYIDNPFFVICWALCTSEIRMIQPTFLLQSISKAKKAVTDPDLMACLNAVEMLPLCQPLRMEDRGAELLQLAKGARHINIARGDLCKRQLAGINLSYAELYGLIAEDANFEEANLSHASLEKANFDKSNFTKANFEKVNADSVTLTYACCDNANISNTNFHSAKLNCTRFNNVQGDRAKFDSANLSSATFNQACLSYASFERSNLQNAQFKNAKLMYANFKQAELFSACFDGANLNNANFCSARLHYSSFDKADLKGCRFIDGKTPLEWTNQFQHWQDQLKDHKQALQFKTAIAYDIAGRSFFEAETNVPLLQAALAHPLFADNRPILQWSKAALFSATANPELGPRQILQEALEKTNLVIKQRETASWGTVYRYEGPR